MASLGDRIRAAEKLSAKNESRITKRPKTEDDFIAQGLNKEQALAKITLDKLKRQEFLDKPVKELNQILQGEQEAPTQQAGGFLKSLVGSSIGQQGLQFLRGLTQEEELDQLPSGENEEVVSERERQLRDNAALAIANGANPIEVNKRLNQLLKGV